MNALIRKFRVASTTGVVMSLAMAGVLAMAPMSNAMAKSQKFKEKDIWVHVFFYKTYNETGAYDAYINEAVKFCGGWGFKTLYSKTNMQDKREWGSKNGLSKYKFHGHVRCDR